MRMHNPGSGLVLRPHSQLCCHLWRMSDRTNVKASTKPQIYSSIGAGEGRLTLYPGFSRKPCALLKGTQQAGDLVAPLGANWLPDKSSEPGDAQLYT